MSPLRRRWSSTLFPEALIDVRTGGTNDPDLRLGAELAFERPQRRQVNQPDESPSLASHPKVCGVRDLGQTASIRAGRVDRRRAEHHAGPGEDYLRPVR